MSDNGGPAFKRHPLFDPGSAYNRLRCFKPEEKLKGFLYWHSSLERSLQMSGGPDDEPTPAPPEPREKEIRCEPPEDDDPHKNEGKKS